MFVSKIAHFPNLFSNHVNKPCSFVPIYLLKIKVRYKCVDEILTNKKNTKISFADSHLWPLPENQIFLGMRFLENIKGP